MLVSGSNYTASIIQIRSKAWVHKNIGNKPNLEGFQSESNQISKALKEEDLDTMINPNALLGTYRVRADLKTS